MTSKKNEKIQLLSKYKISLPCEFGSGKLSLGTRCMTVVLPVGSPRAVKQQKNEINKNKTYYIMFLCDRKYLIQSEAIPASVTFPCKNRPW